MIKQRRTNNNDKETGELRSGYTTGSCAAAAAKAAAIALVDGSIVREVSITLPSGKELSLTVEKVNINRFEAKASVVKDAGDDPDVTDGLAIMAVVRLQPGEIVLRGGTGIGRVTKPGLSVPVGDPAINPVPRSMIRQEVEKVLQGKSGAVVTIEAPGGEKLAAKTLNPRLGIVDGISILGTTGIVRPMSEDAYKRSLVPQIDQAMALGYRHLVLTPGGMGFNKAKALGFSADAIVQTSNFIGTLLEESAKRQPEGIVLFGHIGKLLKVAAGIFHTHSRLADARRETLAAHAAMLGAGSQLVKEIMELNTAEESVLLLRKHGLEEVYFSVASMASRRAEEFCGNAVRVGTVLYSLSGDVLGYDRQAVEIGGVLGWRAK